MLAETEAVSRPLFTKIVGRFVEPSQVTTELAVKFVPVTVRVKRAPPAVTESGLIPVRTGTGLLIRKAKSFVPDPAVGWVLSLTWKVKLKFPAAEGVPLKTPVSAFSVTPGGSEPDASDHW